MCEKTREALSVDDYALTRFSHARFMRARDCRTVKCEKAQVAPSLRQTEIVCRSTSTHAGAAFVNETTPMGGTLMHAKVTIMRPMKMNRTLKLNLTTGWLRKIS